MSAARPVLTVLAVVVMAVVACGSGDPLDARGTLEQCPVHATDLQEDIVPIVAESVSDSPELAESRASSFPLAGTVFLGESDLGRRREARIRYCFECRQARRAWFHGHRFAQDGGDPIQQSWDWSDFLSREIHASIFRPFAPDRALTDGSQLSKRGNDVWVSPDEAIDYDLRVERRSIGERDAEAGTIFWKVDCHWEGRSRHLELLGLFHAEPRTGEWRQVGTVTEGSNYFLGEPNASIETQFLLWDPKAKEVVGVARNPVWWDIVTQGYWDED